MSAGSDDAEARGPSQRNECRALLDATEELFSGSDRRWRRTSVSRGVSSREREVEASAARMRDTHAAAVVRCEQARRKACSKYLRFRRVRAPTQKGAAGRIAYFHDDQLHGAFAALATDAHALTHSGLAGPDGGRRGIIAALAIVSKLIERTPMRDEARRALLEPLKLLQDALLHLDNGVALPMLVPAERRPGRPRDTDNPRFDSLRRRCIMALILLQAIGPNRRNAATQVHAAAKNAAALIGYTPKGGFSVQTVKNWHRRHQTLYGEHQLKKCELEHAEWEFLEREQVDFIVATRNERFVRAHADWYLRALAPENIDRDFGPVLYTPLPLAQQLAY